MRPTETRLRDILEASDAIRQFIDELESYDYFERSPLHQSAIMYQLIIIGEASAQIDDAFKTRYPHIPWDKLKRFRNFAAHQYFGVDWGLKYGISAAGFWMRLRTRLLPP